jgi:hypothetical protein
MTRPIITALNWAPDFAKSQVHNPRVRLAHGRYLSGAYEWMFAALNTGSHPSSIAASL